MSRKENMDLWRRWRWIRYAVNNPNTAEHEYYKTQGWPKAWQEWANFEEDVISTIGPVPWPGACFDKINGRKPYSKNNIRWSTRKQVARDRIDNLRITYQGQTKTLADWADITGIPYKCLYSRIEHGWPLDIAFDPKKWR